MPKVEKLHLKHGNLLTFKPPPKLLTVNPFTIDIDVLGVDESTPLEVAGMAVIKQYQRRLNEDLKKLTDRLTSLQHEEQIGKNPKAWEDAKKEVEKFNEDLAEAADDLRIDIRAAIDKKSGAKTQTFGSVGGKGVQLVRGAFTGAVGDEKFSTFFKKLGKSLAEKTSEIVGKQAATEEKERKALVQNVQDALSDLKKDASRSGDPRREMHDLQGRCQGYTDHLAACREGVEKMSKDFKQLEKLLKEQKEPSGGEKMKVYKKFTDAAGEMIEDLTARTQLVKDVAAMFDDPSRGWNRNLQETALTAATVKLKGLRDFETKPLSDSAKALLILAKKE